MLHTRKLAVLVHHPEAASCFPLSRESPSPVHPDLVGLPRICAAAPRQLSARSLAVCLSDVFQPVGDTFSCFFPLQIEFQVDMVVEGKV